MPEFEVKYTVRVEFGDDEPFSEDQLLDRAMDQLVYGRTLFPKISWRLRTRPKQEWRKVSGRIARTEEM